MVAHRHTLRQARRILHGLHQNRQHHALAQMIKSSLQPRGIAAQPSRPARRTRPFFPQNRELPLQQMPFLWEVDLPKAHTPRIARCSPISTKPWRKPGKLPTAGATTMRPARCRRPERPRGRGQLPAPMSERGVAFQIMAASSQSNSIRTAIQEWRRGGSRTATRTAIAPVMQRVGDDAELSLAPHSQSFEIWDAYRCETFTRSANLASSERPNV